MSHFWPKAMVVEKQITFALRWLKCTCIQVYSRLVTGKFPDFPTTAAMVAKVFHFSHLLAFWRPLLDAGRQSMATKFPGLGRMKPVMWVESNSSFASGGVRGRAWEDSEAFTFLHHSLVALLWYGRLTILFTSALRGFISADWFRSFLQQLSDDGVLLHSLRHRAPDACDAWLFWVESFWCRQSVL